MNKHKITGLVIKIAIPVVILAVLVVILLKRTSSDGISLARYALVKIDGFDGRAVATSCIDDEGILKALTGNEKDERTDKYDDFIKSLSVSLDKESEIRNGDEITATVSYDEKLASKLGIKVTDCTKAVKAENLPEGTEQDAFKDVKIVTSGISPYIYVSCINESGDGYMASLQYDVSKTSGLSVGDEVTITCRADEKTAAEKGIYFKELTKTYKIEQADRYISAPSDIDEKTLKSLSDEDVQTVVAETADKTTHMSFEVTGDKSYLFKDNNEEAQGFEPYKYLLAYNNTGTEQKHENGIVVILHGNIAMQNYSGGEDPYDYLECYFAFMYPDVVMGTDGTITFDRSDPEKRYVCASSYEDLLASVGDRIGPYYDYSEININE